MYNPKLADIDHVIETLQELTCQYELIFVDDASTNGAYDEAKEKCKASDNKFFYRLNKNQGPGAARNYAIKKAKGDYVFFLDIDDDPVPSFFNHALEMDFDKAPDIIGGNVWFRNEGKRLICPQPFDLHFITEGSHKVGVSPALQLPWFHVRYLFNREFLLENQIFYPPSRFGEDPVFVANAFCCAGKVYGLPHASYIQNRSTSLSYQRKYGHLWLEYLMNVYYIISLYCNHGYKSYALTFLKFNLPGLFFVENFNKLQKGKEAEAEAIIFNAVDLFDDKTLQEFSIHPYPEFTGREKNLLMKIKKSGGQNFYTRLLAPKPQDQKPKASCAIRSQADYAKELNDVYASMSWKITRPLRKVYEILLCRQG
jgi:glycosyltransferase involved in cell wall biosynthesis